jgi:hypothetical protein
MGGENTDVQSSSRRSSAHTVHAAAHTSGRGSQNDSGLDDEVRSRCQKRHVWKVMMNIWMCAGSRPLLANGNGETAARDGGKPQ